MQAHLHMRSHARLSKAGSFKRHFANSLRTEHHCDCSARKLALGRTYTGRSFLEEEQHYRAFTESKRLTHCRLISMKTRTLETTFGTKPFWTVRLLRTQQQRTGTLSRPKTWPWTCWFYDGWNCWFLVFPCVFILCDVFERGKFFWRLHDGNGLKEKLQSATLSTPLLMVFGFSLRMITNDDGFSQLDEDQR